MTVGLKVASAPKMRGEYRGTQMNCARQGIITEEMLKIYQ